MKDSRLVELKLKAERDKSLSDGAARLLALIVSERYVSRDHAERDFPLPWSLVASWMGIGEDQAYRRLKELQARNYLRVTGLQGCPPKQHFQLVLNSRKKAGIESSKYAGINSGKSAGNHISISLRDNEINKEGAKVTLAAVISAARAAVTGGG